MAVPERITLDGIELNDGAPWTILEDPGFEFRPAAKKLNWVTSPLSDGAVLSGDEDHYENATMVFAVTCAVQADKDTALSTAHALTQKLQEARRSGNMPLIWTPSGSSGSWTFYVEEAEWEDLGLTKSRGWFDSGPSFTMRLTLRPFAYGAETLTKIGWSDPFFGDGLTGGRWRFDTGSGTVAVSSGALVPSTDVLKRLFVPFTTADLTVTMRLRVGSTTTGQAGVMLKRIDASNYLKLAVDGDVNLVRMRKVVAGTQTTVGVSGAFTPTASTFYWLQARIVGNDMSAIVYSSAQNPLETEDPTPLATASYTLTGGEDTTFGEGVRGNPGIYLDPPATNPAEWVITDYIVTEMDDIRSSEPLTEFEIPNVKGHVPAEGRLVVTEGAAKSMAHFEWGLEARDYNRTVAPPLILDSTVMVASAGSQVVGTNNYDPFTETPTNINAIQSTALSKTTAVTVCFTNARFHTGTYKVKARVSSGADGVRARLAYQVGVSRYIENPYAPPLIGGIKQEIDLGTIIIPEAVLGTHVWSGRIDAYSPLQAGANIVIDYLLFIPQERYGVARAPLVLVTPTTFSVLDSFQQSSGPLNTKPLEIPSQNWTTGRQVGATAALETTGTDFQVVDASDRVERVAVSDASLDAGRYALAGTTNYGAIQVQASVGATSSVQSTISNQLRWGVIARYVDANNWLMAVRQEYMTSGGSQTRTRLRVYKRVGGGAPTLLGTKDDIAASWETRTIALSVDTAGVWQATIWGAKQPGSPTLSGSDTDLAAAGPLATGRVGLYDAYINNPAMTRTFDNFNAFASTQDVVIHPSRNLEVRADRSERESAGGGVWGRVPEYRGDRFLVPAAGDQNYVSRVAAKARRFNVDEGLADSETPATNPITVTVYLTPRYLHPPGVGD